MSLFNIFAKQKIKNLLFIAHQVLLSDYNGLFSSLV